MAILLLLKIFTGSASHLLCMKIQGHKKAPKNIYFAHLVGSTCSNVLKIQQCTEIQYGNPCNLQDSQYPLYFICEERYTLDSQTLFVISSLQDKIWVENPESKETFLTKPIPSEEGK